MDPLFACETGTALWEAFRREHPEAPAIPPEFLWHDGSPEEEIVRRATAYWDHTNTCDDCNEV